MKKEPIKKVETKEDLKEFFEEVRKMAFISFDTESVGALTNSYFPETIIGLGNGSRYVITENSIDREKH